LVGNKVYEKSGRTVADYIVKEAVEFEKVKEEFKVLLKKFYEEGPQITAGRRHPIFGKMSVEDWGKSQYKHIDHHLSQFGV
jgi:hypothetical protein